ncbi:hypothetical protein [Mycoplasma leonicaptivi]|uniref:hypothetical protein n=1 Tax=Mycoplasma leonicaptivi TaxID=36742 RepID=UPI000AB3939B|nr:hypothetical protein [Mycoplasma leonicaptivi]
MIPFGYGLSKQEYENLTKNMTQEEINDYASNVTLKTLLSYLANTFTIIFFMIYLVLARHKIKVGYFFFISWIVVFITFAGLPFYLGIENYSTLKITVGSLITIISCCIIVMLFIVTFQYYAKRKIHDFEMYKIHKGKSR